jgi:hypothetical protein
MLSLDLRPVVHLDMHHRQQAGRGQQVTVPDPRSHGTPLSFVFSRNYHAATTSFAAFPL